MAKHALADGIGPLPANTQMQSRDALLRWSRVCYWSAAQSCVRPAPEAALAAILGVDHAHSA